MADINATEARRSFFEIIKNSVKTHQIYHIHHRDGDAVLMSEEEYESLQETLSLLSIPGFRESISRSADNMANGETFSIEEVLGNDE